MPAIPSAGRRTASAPISAANRATNTVVPVSSAVLSWVPKVATAKFLTGPGTESTTTPPTATSGADRGPANTATSSATPSATAAAAIPATGPTHRLLSATAQVSPARTATGSGVSDR